jgi:CubicO group peptidase (beta-lactamase class C family)
VEDFMSSSIDKVLAAAVAEGAVPNVAAIAADADGIVYEGAAGAVEAGSDGPSVSVDTQFRIMSMTKIVTTTAALQLVEAGQLDLDAPVERYLPEFADRQVIAGFDSGADGDVPKLREPASRPTVKHLVTHTSGLGYWFFSDELVRWEAATGNPPLISGDALALTTPMVHDPGERYTYGINSDILGKIIEAISGVTLDVVFKDKITGPLGMDNTAFLMTDGQRANSTPVHVHGEDGSWVSAGEILNQEPGWWAGGHGLYSTPRDYIRFQRALLRGGELDGERILSSDTVDAMFTNQIGDLDFPAEIPSSDPASSCDFNAGPGWKWGLGLLLNSTDLPGMRRAWSGSWAGLCNTHFWVDRASGIAASLYSNFLPFADPPALQLYADFERELYASR